MNSRTLLAASALVACLAASQSMACGEGQFNMGQGMRYQAYLAPRPATVLVYDQMGAGTSPEERANLYRGLQQAGHKVTVVGDVDNLSKAVAGNHYDVVIADFAEVEQLASISEIAANQTRLLPVVQRKARNSPELREHFVFFLVDGASLGQYLKVINQALLPKP